VAGRRQRAPYSAGDISEEASRGWRRTLLACLNIWRRACSARTLAGAHLPGGDRWAARLQVCRAWRLLKPLSGRRNVAKQRRIHGRAGLWRQAWHATFCCWRRRLLAVAPACCCVLSLCCCCCCWRRPVARCVKGACLSAASSSAFKRKYNAFRRFHTPFAGAVSNACAALCRASERENICILLYLVGMAGHRRVSGLSNGPAGEQA